MATYVGNIQVVYGDSSDQRPDNYIQEFVAGTGDINQDFGGKFVWLTPVPVDDDNPVVSAMELIVQGEEIPGMSDLAAGAGGDFRYLFPKFGPWKMRDLVLFRTTNGIDGVPYGYDGRTDDLNTGRGKSYLYLLWKHDAK